MHAIILAAGRGRRLAEHNPEGLPKCLLEFGGRSLLSRHLRRLLDLRVARVDLVVGFQADRVVDHVGNLSERPAVAFRINPRFELGSVISLLAARPALECGDSVLVMDADVLYHPAILDRLAGSPHPNCFLLDRGFVPGDEPVKVAVKDGVMVEFRKRLPEGLAFDLIGESVGFFRFDPDMAATMAAECERYESEGMADLPHEEAMRDVLLRRPEEFGFEDVTGLPWLEIDFPEDVARARDEVLPAIRADLPNY